MERLHKEAVSIPSDVQRRLSAAKDCWNEHASQLSSLMDAGLSKEEARDRMSSKAAICTRNAKAAATERHAYLGRARDQLTWATGNNQAHETALAETTSNVRERVDPARSIEAEPFTPRSSTVLWSLLKSTPGALAKGLIVSFLLLVCELPPLLQKIQAGQSNIGRWIAANSRICAIALQGSISKRHSR